jgi:hypothetical protein
MAITRLNNNSITSVTALPSGIDVGKVLQVVSDISTTKTTCSTTSLTDVADLGVSITPSNSSSLIYVTIHLAGMRRVSGSNYFRIELHRQVNGGGYSQAEVFENGFLYSGSALVQSSAYTNTWVDDHNQTAQLDYKIQIKKEIAGDSITINNDQQEASRITAMEIAG